jgi:hypothetical protein
VKANPIRRGKPAPRRAPDRLGEFAKIDCAACHHVALLTPETLLSVGLSRGAKVLDLRGRLRWDRVRTRGSLANMEPDWQGSTLAPSENPVTRR